MPREQERDNSSRSNTGEQRSQTGLKEREYTDKDGNVRHHTKKYMDQHGKDDSS